MLSCDEVLRIEDVVVPMLELLHRERIHVMHVHPVVNLKARNATIASEVPSDDQRPCLLPLIGAVEVLVEHSFPPKGSFPHRTPKLEVTEAIVEVIKPIELGACPNRHTVPPTQEPDDPNRSSWLGWRRSRALQHEPQKR